LIGAEAIIRTLVAGGVDTCFVNPGTTEIHLVAVLDRLTETRCILALFEGVITGAADGYARMAEKPAWTLLHLGPGFANGLANLHNASRAQIPMINVVGQHATYHIRRDTPLTADIEGLARPYSKWLRTICSAAEAGFDVAEAICASQRMPGNIATLIVPSDVSWSEGGAVATIPASTKAPRPATETVERIAGLLRSGVKTAILLGGNTLYGKGLQAAGQVAQATGAKLLAPYPLTRLERGAGTPDVERVHYILEAAKEQLKEFRQMILVGTVAPVAYFAYPNKDSTLTGPECAIHTLAGVGEDCAGAMQDLVEALPMPVNPQHAVANIVQRRPMPSGKITTAGLADAISALMPENTIVVDESMTSGRELMPSTKLAPRHDWLGNTGGAIGIAMPLALGAAVACPERQVLCLSADGSGMYTVQALWTMARESLRIVTVIFANRVYGVLKREFSFLGTGPIGPRAADMFDICRPDLDWVMLARGMGVPASRVTSLEEFSNALINAFQSGGPSLIEVLL
jgi:acetolactate synthase-1/2/3 large subunit